MTLPPCAHRSPIATIFNRVNQRLKSNPMPIPMPTSQRRTPNRRSTKSPTNRQNREYRPSKPRWPPPFHSRNRHTALLKLAEMNGNERDNAKS